jgi:hypothetical protein
MTKERTAYTLASFALAFLALCIAIAGAWLAVALAPAFWIIAAGMGAVAVLLVVLAVVAVTHGE